MLHRQPDPPPPPTDDHLATLEEVAAELDCSVGRAFQIEAQALNKCRRWLREHGLDTRDMRD